MRNEQLGHVSEHGAGGNLRLFPASSGWKLVLNSPWPWAATWILLVLSLSLVPDPAPLNSIETPPFLPRQQLQLASLDQEDGTEYVFSGSDVEVVVMNDFSQVNLTDAIVIDPAGPIALNLSGRPIALRGKFEAKVSDLSGEEQRFTEILGEQQRIRLITQTKTPRTLGPPQPTQTVYVEGAVTSYDGPSQAGHSIHNVHIYELEPTQADRVRYQENLQNWRSEVAKRFGLRPELLGSVDDIHTAREAVTNAIRAGESSTYRPAAVGPWATKVAEIEELVMLEIEEGAKEAAKEVEDGKVEVK
jgi:hypothetical protein